ncbi:ubiquitin-protein ligase E3C-like [Styela clava]
MYSFEGKFRTTPNVSLGGKSKEDKLNKERLLQKAQKERQKREEIRRRLQSALVLQSCVRSYLVRQRLKNDLRIQFDQERHRVSNKIGNINELVATCRWLKFFYEPSIDHDRLTWLGQLLLRNKEDWLKNDDSSLFQTAGVLKLCCRCLSSIDSTTTIAIPMRVLETFTSNDLVGSSRKLENRETEICLLKLWNALVRNGYFSCIQHLLTIRVPSDIPSEGDSPIHPPTHLAGTLLNLLTRPIIVAGQTSDSQPSQDTMDYSDPITERQAVILRTFISEVLCKHPTSQMYHYVFPAFAVIDDFPTFKILETVRTMLPDLDLKSPGLLPALVKFVHPKLESVPERTFSGYLYCLQCLLTHLPRIRCHDDEENDYDSSDSDQELDADSAENRMETSTNKFQGDVIPLADLVSDCHSALTSRQFTDACVGRRIHEQSGTESLDSICAICHHLIVVTKVSVQKNRLLYTLAFSSSFLRKLWQSTVSLTSTSKVTGKSIPVVQLLFEGSQISESKSIAIRSKLVVFCSLFCHNLLSVHDTDFYNITQGSSRHMAFTVAELVSIALTIRDVCLALIKQALPETRSRFGNFNAKNVLHALSFGQTIRPEKFSGSKDVEIGLSEINDTVFLFTVCRRLVKQLHTRDSRRSFIPNRHWLSNLIYVKNDQSNDFAQRWYRRSGANSTVAAHLANTSDEDIILSVTEARQLAVLMNIPFVIPFDTRVSIFTTMLHKDRESRETHRDRIMEEAGFGHSSMTNEVTVRREFIYEDAFNDLSEENAPDLRKRLRVTFVNSAGLDEAGYGAGVTREFLQQVVKTGFDPTRGFFKTTAQGRLYPNPHASAITPNANSHFHFLGRMLGKVLYEGMQVELPFASFFLCKILQRKNTDVDINHLQSLDPDFYRNLMYLHDYDGDVSDLALNFTVVDETLGVTKVNELMPDGINTPLTNSNKVLYMHLMANFKLNIQMRSPCQRFRRGLESVVTVDWLQMFDHVEFQTLVSGAEVPIDIEDLKRYTTYSGGYSADHPTVESFWEALKELTNNQLSLFLLFVTSCSRPPLLGFKELQPPFCIQRGGSEDRLPTASTCLNLLKLPEYHDSETLKSKLIYCLQSGTGFELS